MTERLLVFDAPSLWFRAFYGAPRTVTAPDGTPVNAVRGFIDYVARHLRDYRPGHFVAALDNDWRPQWRVDLIPDYKLHRVAEDGGDGEPDELTPQVDIILDVLRAVGLCALGADGYEADDVAGTLSVTHDGPVDIVTGDRDLFQLVRDEPHPVRIVYTVEKMRPYGPAEVAARFGIPGAAYAEYALLRGDASDGLPGAVGIGDKTAAALVSHFGTVAAMLVAAHAGSDDGFPSGARRKLLVAGDYLAAAERVVQVARDVPLGNPDTRVPGTPADPDALVELSARWGLDSPCERLLRSLELVAAR